MSSPTPSAGPPLDHTGNLLGALSLSVADRTADAVGDAAGQSQTAAIALSALNDFLDAPSMDRLRSVLGLTPSGAVRLVDRLQDSGYVTRRRGEDARSVSVHLTPAGRRVARRVAAARAQVLREVLGDLTAAERATLDGLLVARTAGADPRPRRHPLDVPVLRHHRLRTQRGPLPGGQRGTAPVRGVGPVDADARLKCRSCRLN